MSTVDRDIERLSAVFKQGPLREWPVEDIAKDKIMRFAETYLMMARTGYRPAAPSDGLGNIQLDEERLYREAAEYALKFNREEVAARSGSAAPTPAPTAHMFCRSRLRGFSQAVAMAINTPRGCSSWPSRK